MDQQQRLERMRAYHEWLRGAETDVADLRARLGTTIEALTEIKRYALAVVGASDAYGEAESAHLWQEIADLADKGLEV